MSSSRKIVRSFFYTIGSGYFARFCSVAATVLLKRELGPEVFDITAKALFIFTLLAGLRDFGWMHSLLHFQDRVHEFVDTHLILNFAISLLVCLGACGVGVGLYLYEPEVYGWPATVIWIFSATHLLRSLTQTSEALLRMEFEFGKLSLFHGTATVLALGSALVAAWSGWGRWSLILGGWTTYSVFSVVYVLFYSIAIWRSQPLRLRRLHFDWIWARRLLSYGKWFWLAWGVLLSFIWNFDKLVLVVLQKEAGELAFYENAWWLMQLPTAIITHMIFSYTNTLYSKYQNDRRQLSELFSRMMGLILRISAPLALLFVFNAADITALLGPEWAPAASIMIWFAGYAFFRPLIDDGLGLLWAVGDTRRSALIMVVQAGLVLLLAPTMWGIWGIDGLAGSMGVVAAGGVIGLLYVLPRYVDVAWGRVFGAPLLGLAGATVAGYLYGESRFSLQVVDLFVRCSVIGLVFLAIMGSMDYRYVREEWQQLRGIFMRR